MENLQIQNTALSTVSNVRENTGKQVTLAELIHEIMNPSSQQMKRILRLAGLKKKERDKEKKSLPAFIPAGVHSDGDVRNKDSIIPSHLIYIDVDAADNPRIKASEMKTILSEIKGNVLSSLSVSRTGAFGLFLVETQSEEHWLHLTDELSEKGLISDRACKDLMTRRVFIPYDRDLIVNYDAEMRMDSDLPETITAKISDLPEKETKSFFYGEIPFEEHSEVFFRNLYRTTCMKVGNPGKSNFTNFITSWAGRMISHNISEQDSMHWLSVLCPECLATDSRRETHRDIFSRYRNSNVKVQEPTSVIEQRTEERLIIPTGCYVKDVLPEDPVKLDRTIIYSGMGTGKTHQILDWVMKGFRILLAVPTIAIAKDIKRSVEKAIGGMSEFERMKYKRKSARIQICSGEAADPLSNLIIACYPSVKTAIRKMSKPEISRLSLIIDEAHHSVTWGSESFQGSALDSVAKLINTERFRSVTALTATVIPEMFWTSMFKDFKIIRIHEETPRLTLESQYCINDSGLDSEEYAFFLTKQKIEEGHGVCLTHIAKKQADKFTELCDQFKFEHRHISSETVNDEEIQDLISRPLSSENRALIITHTAVLESGVNLNVEPGVNVALITTNPYLNGPVNAVQAMGRVRNAGKVTNTVIFSETKNSADAPPFRTPAEQAEAAHYILEKESKKRDEIGQDLVRKFSEFEQSGRSHLIPGYMWMSEKFLGITFTEDGQLVHSNSDEVYDTYKLRMWALARNPNHYLGEMELYGVKNKGEYKLEIGKDETRTVVKAVKEKAKKVKKERDLAALKYVQTIIAAETPEEREALLDEKPVLKDSYKALEKVASYSFETPDEREEWINSILLQTNGNSNKIKREIENHKIRLDPTHQKAAKKLLSTLSPNEEYTGEQIKETFFSNVMSFMKGCFSSTSLNIRKIMGIIRAFFNVKEHIRRIDGKVTKTYTLSPLPV